MTDELTAYAYVLQCKKCEEVRVVNQPRLEIKEGLALMKQEIAKQCAKCKGNVFVKMADYKD